VSTAGIVDKQQVPLKGVYEITKTKTYNTATGTHTVLLLEPARPPRFQ
jgi:hypothetical protein